MSFRFQFRRGTTAERDASNPILAAGEPAVVLDSGQPAELVLGDGVTAMADLRAAVWDDDARLALAGTATQPGDLGTAAAADVGDFGTAAQGAKADTAVQPGALAPVATTGIYSDLTGKPAIAPLASEAETIAGVDNTKAVTPASGAAAYLAKASGTLGAEIITNGTFTTNLSGWVGAGWAWLASAAKHTPGSATALTQAAAVPVVGTTYALSITTSGVTAGQATIYVGGGYLIGTTGTFTGYITATSADALRVIPTDDFDGSVDSVSMKALTSTPARVDSGVTFTKPITLTSGINVATGVPISLGKDALKNTAGLGVYSVPSSNVGIGYQAGMNTTTGHITAVGYRAGEANTDGVLTAFGKWAGLSNTTGHTTVYGNAAGMKNTTGNIDVFGDEAGADNTTGTIAAFGYYAAHTNVTGTVTAVGHLAGDQMGTDSTCTIVGHMAGRLYTGDGGTMVGQAAGQVATTARLVAVGHEALRNATTGPATAVGFRAGYGCTSSDSTFIGYQAGYASTTGQVVAIGASAALEVTTGGLIAIGKRAGYGLTIANSPKTDTAGILIGEFANRSVPSATALIEYVGIGYNALVGAHGAVSIGTNSNASHTDSVALGRSSATSAANQVMVGNRDVESTRTGGGVILKSPDGTRYKVAVANGGTISVVAA